jgi:hypothetical protein
MRTEDIDDGSCKKRRWKRKKMRRWEAEKVGKSRTE